MCYGIFVWYFFHVLGAIFGISSFILAVITLVYLIKSLRKIKNKGEKINEQNNSIKKRYKNFILVINASSVSTYHWRYYILLTFSISIGSMGPFYF